MTGEGIMEEYSYWVPALPFFSSVMGDCYAAQGGPAPKPLKIKELY